MIGLFDFMSQMTCFVFFSGTINEPWRVMLISGCNYRMISVATGSDENVEIK